MDRLKKCWTSNVKTAHTFGIVCLMIVGAAAYGIHLNNKVTENTDSIESLEKRIDANIENVYIEIQSMKQDVASQSGKLDRIYCFMLYENDEAERLRCETSFEAK